MAITRGRLTAPKMLEPIVSIPAPAPFYTAPAGTTAFVSGYTFFNTDDSVQDVVIRWKPASGASIDLNAFSLSPSEQLILEYPSDGLVLQAGDELDMRAADGGVVSCILHGVRDL